MKKNIIPVLLMFLCISCHTRDNAKNDMENKSSTIRLVYPQWQGGGSINPEAFMPELKAQDAVRGYYLGSQLLNFLAPETNQTTVEVPVSLDIENRQVKNGIVSYDAILKQTKDALALLDENNPERIITLGGDCAVSVVPFTWLMAKYPDDIAVVWIDAHPDINLPGDSYDGYHAMALTACIGMGDEKIINTLPAKATASRALIVGLRAWDTGMKERQAELGIRSLSPAEIAVNSMPVLEWLKSTGASKVVIHFDLDVLDPKEIIAAVGTDPDGMKIEEVVRLINDIASEFDLVGLTVAEPMPRTAIKIRNMLRQLPMLED